MPAVIASPGPFYVRYNALPAAALHTEPFALGKAETLSQGSDVAILTYGFLLREAVRARQTLEAAGRSVRVVNLRTLKPVDEEAVLSAVRECRLTVTLEDHFSTGGLYSIVAELLLSRGVTGRVLPIALPERWFTPGRLPEVLDAEGFTGEKIAARISTALG
jgi:transketolase